MTQSGLHALPPSDEFSQACALAFVGDNGEIIVVVRLLSTCCACEAQSVAMAVIHSPERGDHVSRPFCATHLQIEVLDKVRGSQRHGQALSIVNESPPEENDT